MNIDLPEILLRLKHGQTDSQTDRQTGSVVTSRASYFTAKSKEMKTSSAILISVCLSTSVCLYVCVSVCL